MQVVIGFNRATPESIGNFTKAAAPITAAAAGQAGVGEAIIRAADPIIEIAQAASYPLAFLWLTGGFLLIMTGNKSKGIEKIKWAGIGYVGLQFVPFLMKLLANIGTEIEQELEETRP